MIRMFVYSLNRRHYEMPNETLDKRSLYMRQVHEELHNQLRTLGQKYVNMLLGSDREKAVDHFYGVHIPQRERHVQTNISM